MPAYLINEIPNIQNLSYLELGIFDGVHLSCIGSRIKTSVDRDNPADFRMSTDDFFAQLDPTVKFDLVYIDADHHCTSIQKDFNNCLKHLTPTGSIFLHDLFPQTEELTAPHYCNNGYVFLDALIRQRYPKIYTLDDDYGVTLVHQPKNPVLNMRENLSYKDFRKENINYQLQTRSSFIDVVRELKWE